MMDKVDENLAAHSFPHLPGKTAGEGVFKHHQQGEG